MKALSDTASSQDIVGAMLTRSAGSDGHAKAGGVYSIECRDSEGNLKWAEELHNLVVNVGLQDMNAKYFSGSSYTATWFLGLINGPGSGTSILAADTALTHSGWTENVGYSNANRPTATFGTATTAMPSVISNSAGSGGTVATFNINATSTIAGAFLISNNTKSGTTGTLFSASDFTSPGDRSVVSGDTLNVTYQFSLTAT
jgi:hypothetical protein